MDDFHTIDKSYIFTLNVCATKELHRKVEAQEERIKELETKNKYIIIDLNDSLYYLFFLLMLLIFYVVLALRIHSK